MNPQAYEILAEMKVNLPQEYCVDEILSCQHENKYFYCRFSTISGLNSRFYKGKEITNKIHWFEQLQRNKELLKIEEVVNCICGCVIYINDGCIYGEFVNGHIMSLLRKGVCSMRFLIDSNNGVYLINQFQRWIVQQKNNKFILKTNDNFDESQFNIIQDLIVYLRSIDFTKDNSLFELMVSKDKYVFCDAKIFSEDDFSLKTLQLFIDKKDKIVIKSPKKIVNLKSIHQVDCFDVDYKMLNNDLSNNNIIVYNDALLSHFITRNFKHFNSIFFLRRDNKVRYLDMNQLLST
jgi:hypothetical protein